MSSAWSRVEYGGARQLAARPLEASSPTPHSTFLSHSTSSSLLGDSQSDELEDCEMVDENVSSGSMDDDYPRTPSPSPFFPPLTQLPLAYYRSSHTPATPPTPFPVLFVSTSSPAQNRRTRPHPQLLDRIVELDLLGPASQLPLLYRRGSTNFSPSSSPPTFFPSLDPSLTPRPTLDAFLASSPSTTARALALARLSTLESRSKVWCGVVPCEIDSVLGLRRLVLEWLHDVSLSSVSQDHS